MIENRPAPAGITPHGTRRPRRRAVPPRLIVALCGLGVSILSGIALMTPAPVDAAGNPGTASDGSDWGSQGTLASASGVTLRWDNKGNPAGSTVQRNQRQVLPHTGGKTYADIAPAAQALYESHFGASNGFGGLTVTVSQTADLVNQGLNLDISGVNPAIPNGKQDSSSYLQVMECWGSLTAQGAAAADTSASTATDPDPTTCEYAGIGPDAIGGVGGRAISTGNDPLLGGGDWRGTAVVPFRAIDGTVVTTDLANQFFNRTTTNEFDHVTVAAAGTASRTFEAATGSEAPGLGCGRRADAPSTSSCWLVVVPRLTQDLDRSNLWLTSPLSPSVWGQRLQVKLTYQDVAAGCGTNAARVLIGGSALLAGAAGAWAPGICTTTGGALGYSRQPDAVARAQYAAGADAIVTTQPLAAADATDTAYVPVALTAPVIAYTLDYHPLCTDASGLNIRSVTTEADAKACGYDSLAALTADLARDSSQVRDLRLTPLLVAKLLTQSYADAMPSFKSEPAWMSQRPLTLLDDPDFRALNPQLHMNAFDSGFPDLLGLSTLIVEAGRSDAASQVWAWLLADPAAAAFLSGCPDPHGTVINPFYSSRTYTGCQAKATALDKRAVLDRAQTPSPDTFTDLPQVYPPDGAPYPQPDWLQYDRNGDLLVRQTITDLLPRSDSMSVAAHDVFYGNKPQRNVFCPSSEGDGAGCNPPPGRLLAPPGHEAYGSRGGFAITAAPDAARYRIPTALLCQDGGAHCAAATSGTVQQAADGFSPDADSGTLQPPGATLTSYAGAYPMSMPVYAAVRTSLPSAERSHYADALAYVTGSGQTPGFRAGMLPPGYAPLTPALRDAATQGIAALRAGVATPPPASGPAAPHQGGHGQPGQHGASTPSQASGSSDPLAAPGASVPAVPPAQAPTVTSAVEPTATPGALVPAAAGTETWFRFTLPLGLAIALLAGLSGPGMRSRVLWRVRWLKDGR